MNDITQPLRLARGSHSEGSGAGCAMNVISWENGDSTITDYPECSNTEITEMIQQLNDQYCVHTELERVGAYGTSLVRMLCAPCSVIVLATAHRSIGTSNRDMNYETYRAGIREVTTRLREVLGFPDAEHHSSADRLHSYISAYVYVLNGPSYNPSVHLFAVNTALDIWEDVFNLGKLDPPSDEKVAEAFKKMMKVGV